MTYRVLITAPYFQPVAHRFSETFGRYEIEPLLPPVIERLSAEQIIPLIAEIDGVICGDDAYTEEVLGYAPRLRVISKWGTGIDSIDLEACRRRGIAVCNTPNAFSEAVADSTMGYILFFVRQLHNLSHDMGSGRWVKRGAPSLGECSVGLIGLGNVGQAVGKRLAPFGARILGTDPVLPPASFLSSYQVKMVEKKELLAESDVVSLHCDLNPTSFRIIDQGALERMHPNSYLINTARGKLVEEAALVVALQRGRLAGAALDVFEEEPLPASSPLRSVPNVFLAPHNANSSPQAWERVHRRTVENLIRHLCHAEGQIVTDDIRS
jgi:D-3-phosphoglycerate dehydrogenase